MSNFPPECCIKCGKPLELCMKEWNIWLYYCNNQNCERFGLFTNVSKSMKSLDDKGGGKCEF